MAAQLKLQFGTAVPREIARMIAAVHPDFDARSFLVRALRGYAPLTLTQRARQIAAALRHELPADYPVALRILMESAVQPRRHRARHGMSSFLFMPHGYFIAEHGLDHFGPSMAAQHLLTRLFTAEFSIRPFLQRHPRRTLALLARWARDPDPRVRRLVSEGTRPRLPWAARLPEFQRDPAPVLALIERLKDDPDPAVRRSVANNLNDIGRDHPALLVSTARRWLRDASPERQRLVRHALRSLVKQGNAGALSALGFGRPSQASVSAVTVSPARPRIGGQVAVRFTLSGRSPRTERLAVDLVVHYMKANGRSAPRTFKLKTLQLGPEGRVELAKTLSLAQMTTRRHHPGPHRLQVLINGRPIDLGHFQLKAR